MGVYCGPLGRCCGYLGHSFAHFGGPGCGKGQPHESGRVQGLQPTKHRQAQVERLLAIALACEKHAERKFPCNPGRANDDCLQGLNVALCGS